MKAREPLLGSKRRGRLSLPKLNTTPFTLLSQPNSSWFSDNLIFNPEDHTLQYHISVPNYSAVFPHSLITFLYFEIVIQSFPTNSQISIGLKQNSEIPSTSPGLEPNSIGYHSDGKLYFQGEPTPFGPTFRVGDKIGCGLQWNYEPDKIQQNSEQKPHFLYLFFTKNGRKLPQLSTKHYNLSGFFPFIGFTNSDIILKVNFNPTYWISDLLNLGHISFPQNTPNLPPDILKGIFSLCTTKGEKRTKKKSTSFWDQLDESISISPTSIPYEFLSPSFLLISKYFYSALVSLYKFLNVSLMVKETIGEYLFELPRSSPVSSKALCLSLRCDGSFVAKIYLHGDYSKELDPDYQMREGFWSLVRERKNVYLEFHPPFFEGLRLYVINDEDEESTIRIPNFKNPPTNEGAVQKFLQGRTALRKRPIHKSTEEKVK